MRRTAKKRNTLGRFILWSVVIAVAALLGAGLYGYVWIQGYLKSDAFRAQLAAQLGRAANAEATIDSLAWSGSDVSVSAASLSPKGSQSWNSISADGIHANLDLGAARDGVWRVTRLNAETLRLDMRAAAQIPTSVPLEFEEHAASSVPQWLRRWIPTRAQIDEVQVQTFDLTPPKGETGVKATGVMVDGNPASDTGAWKLRGRGGKLSVPGISEAFRIGSMSARLDEKALAIHDATARWLGDSVVTARGDVPFDGSRPWSFHGLVSGLDLRHLLDADWNSRLTGSVEADYSASATSQTAKVRVKDGIVQNLPVFDNVATFTRVDRFRRIVLDTASAEVERTGNVTKVSKLDLQSAGLIRVEGSFVIQDGMVNGDLVVGVSPDALAWIPGSRDHVFTQRRDDAPGYVWTTVRISGPADAPREDLTNRVLLAMGRAPLDMAGKGVEVLTGSAGGLGGDSAKSAVDAAQGAVKTGADVLKTGGDAAGKAAETGMDIIKGVLPILGK